MASIDTQRPPAAPKYALITGCSPGGIGHALALTLSAPPYNYHVLATVRDPSSPNLSSLSRPNITVLPLDVTSNNSVSSLLTTISNLTPRLHLLVNNAGRNYTVPGTEVSMAEVRSVFETNVFSVIKLTNNFFPLLLAATSSSTPPAKGFHTPTAYLTLDPSTATPRVFRPVLSALNVIFRVLTLGLVNPSPPPAPRPTIINIGSLAAELPYVFGSVYNASKAALHSYGDTLRLELEPLGIDVVTIVTGGVKSNIGRVERVLKEGSRYAAAQDEYQRRQKYAAEVGMRSEEYARRVAKRVLGQGERGFVWEGAMVGLARAATWMPQWVVGWWMGSKFGLAKIGKRG
ncbi:NADP-dependent 3-hydroxy acid dehydrogenase [Sphaceloma murrayae]|uniref:NADP-dependent 3-hydroxy acid dehydrogenase n=1 Tax=Sphaceloma murrayae TaxID=2082308 RepID=A0A2K1QH05_9PEZI|nr:NADP-dependent 3-hydroxy acid dehydrogenase [Sphaceloma murrayae]